MSDEARTIYCGNLAHDVTEDLLYELFLQAAPLEKVRIPTDRNGSKCSYGFVTVKHEVSVPYAVQLLDGIMLCHRKMIVKPRTTQQPEKSSQPLEQISSVNSANNMLHGLLKLNPMQPMYVENNRSGLRVQDRLGFDRMDDRRRDGSKRSHHSHLKQGRSEYSDYHHSHHRRNRRY